MGSGISICRTVPKATTKIRQANSCSKSRTTCGLPYLLIFVYEVHMVLSQQVAIGKSCAGWHSREHDLLEGNPGFQLPFSSAPNLTFSQHWSSNRLDCCQAFIYHIRDSFSMCLATGDSKHVTMLIIACLWLVPSHTPVRCLHSYREMQEEEYRWQAEVA